MIDLELPDFGDLAGANYQIYPKYGMIHLFGVLPKHSTLALQGVYDYLHEAVKHTNGLICLHVSFEVWNGQSVRRMSELITILEDFMEQGGAVLIKWYYLVESKEQEKRAIGIGGETDVPVVKVGLRKSDWEAKCTGSVGILGAGYDEEKNYRVYPATGVFELVGWLLLDEVNEFSGLLNAYLYDDSSNIAVHFMLFNFNTANSKLILDVMTSLEEFDGSVEIVWLAINEDMTEAGEEFNDLTTLPIAVIPLRPHE